MELQKKWSVKAGNPIFTVQGLLLLSLRVSYATLPTNSPQLIHVQLLGMDHNAQHLHLACVPLGCKKMCACFLPLCTQV